SRILRCARSAASTYCQIRLRRPRSRALSPRRLHRFATTTGEKSGLTTRDNAVFHDESHAPGGRNVARGITVDGNQVGKQTISNSADPVLHVQHACIDGRCRAQRIEGRHSEVDHGFELTAVIAVSKHTDIAAAGYRDMRFKGGPETGTLPIDITPNRHGSCQ